MIQDRLGITLAPMETEELEEEIITKIKEIPSQDPIVLAEGLGLSKSGTTFLITKLRREGRI